MYDDEASLRAALAAGADGYLLKQDTETDFISALDKVMGGEHFVSSKLYHQALATLIGRYRGENRTSEEILTPRQRQVLKLIAEGQNNREIADLLSISVKTVEHHRANIMARLKLNNMAELIRYAVAKGFVDRN